MDDDVDVSQDVQQDASVAHIPNSLFVALFPADDGKQKKQSRPAVSITPRWSTSSNGAQPGSVICWAERVSDEKCSKPEIAPQVAEWLHMPCTPAPCSLSPATPIQLASLILQAEDEASYAWAQQSREQLHNDASEQQSIVRQGSTVELGASRFACLLCEPVLQGYVHPQNTSVIVLAPSSSKDSDSQDPDPAQHLPEGDLVDIDESFLDRSLASKDDHSSPLAVSGPRESMLGAVALSKPLWDVASPGQDETVHCYASEATLARIGALSGDWLLISHQVASDVRLVRVWVSSKHVPLTPDTLALHPMLLWNLMRASSSSSPSRLTVRPFRHSPEHVQLPARCPVATGCTLSRIATSLSVNRTYEPLFLAALKRHLAARHRLLKKGDWLAVPIDTTSARWIKESGQSAEPQRRADDALVFFRIEAVSLPEKQGTLEAVDTGRYGFLLDPSVTQVMQAGSEHALLPADPPFGLASYYSLPLPAAPLHSPAHEGLVDAFTAATDQTALQLGLPVSVLLSGARKSGKTTTVRSAAATIALDVAVVNCFELIGENDVKTEGMLRARFDRAMDAAPCVLVLENVDALARKSQSMESGQDSRLVAALSECLNETVQHWQDLGWPVITVATTTDTDKLPTTLLSCFKTRLQISAPQEAARLSMLESLLHRHTLSPDVDLHGLAVHTAALLAGDLAALVDSAWSYAIDRASHNLTAHPSAVQQAGVSICAQDFTGALEAARSAYSESIGAPKIPNVTWDDVGGLADVKSDILDTVQLPLQQPELFAGGLKKRSGILLYGPPGTGKTLLAKAVATSCALNFFSVKGPELLNMYIGESEANVRRIFQRARDAAPCVIFFDELDSVAPKRGNQGDAGGVMDRIVSQMLAELDGMSEGSEGSQVFVIGATNRPDLLDSALLRPGRFDRMLYLGVSQDHAAQRNILEALTRKFQLAPDADLNKIAEACPYHFTGADFYALCSDAMLKAMTRTASEIDARIDQLQRTEEWSGARGRVLTPQYYLAELATPQETQVRVSHEDFGKALAELSPSVSVAEMAHYAKVQEQFASSTIGKDGSEKKGKAKSKGKGKAKA